MTEKSDFICPVAYTQAAREVAIDWDEESSSQQLPQKSHDRKMLVESMAAHAIARYGHGQSVAFEVYLVPRDGQSIEQQKLTLMASLARQGLYILIHMPDEAVDSALPDRGQTLINMLRPHMRRAA